MKYWQEERTTYLEFTNYEQTTKYEQTNKQTKKPTNQTKNLKGRPQTNNHSLPTFTDEVKTDRIKGLTEVIQHS